MGAKKLLTCMSLLLLASSVSGQSYYYFSPDEYTFWKDRIKETNQEAYIKILQCEKDFMYHEGTENHIIPCILKNSDSDIDVLSPKKKSNGYPILVLPSEAAYSNHPNFTSWLEYYSSIKRIPPITRGEIIHILSVIKQLAPELYSILKQVDPDGFGHIVRDYTSGINATVTFSTKNGLPILAISHEISKVPIKYLRFILGHELGHYVLKHNQESMAYEATHSPLHEKAETRTYEGRKKG